MRRASIRDQGSSLEGPECKNTTLKKNDSGAVEDNVIFRSVTRELADSGDDVDATQFDSDMESSPGYSKQGAEVEKEVPYSLLTYRQKWIMVALLTSAGFWSSLGSPIYYPALKELEKQFNVDEELINVTVVVYLLFQGIAPTVSGGLADVYGRRPIILMGMLVYVVGSIALACAQSYGVIVFLRCLQSAGISPIIAINAGVAGDFTVKAERGTFVGAVSGFTLMGQAFGSLIGAALTAAYDWRAIFWFLSIGCGSCMIILCFLLVETKRTIVGNLSIKPKRSINKAPVIYLPMFQKQFKFDNPDYESLDTSIVKLDLTAALRIVALPEITLSLLPAAFQFALWTLSLASLSSELAKAPYNYKLTIIGICYLPSGIGGLLGSFCTGKIIDVFYRYDHGKFMQKMKNGLIDENTRYNIFKARLVSGMPQNFIAVVSFTIMGWAYQERWNVAVILVTSFFGSFCAMSTLSTSSTLLVDLYPSKSSTATSCYNFIRCVLGAIFMACYAKMKKSMTIGGTFTFISGLVLIGNFIVFIPMKYGMKWRYERGMKG